jgi:hypothetical protein
VEFIAFLEQLVAAYPDRPLLLVLDNASIHKAKAVAQWLTAHTHVELLYLPTYSGHKENPVDRLRELMAAHLGGTITDEERSELATLLTDELGIDLDTIVVAADTDPDTVAAGVAEPVAAGAVSETRRTFDAATYEGAAIVTAALDGARLPAKLRESVAARVPARFTEGDLRALIEPARALAAELEARDILTTGPRVPGDTRVVKEARDKAVERLDRTLEGAHPDAFRSFRQMFAAFHPEARHEDLEGGEFAYAFLRESYAGGRREGQIDLGGRVSEAITSASFAEALGDSVPRRMIAEYQAAGLDDWRQIVSSIESVNDFRPQRLTRIGGYSTLPTVAESGNYAALTSPTDEEVVYTVGKRGGTEDLTLEAIANDDIRALRRIPTELGRAAAVTLHRFVWGLITANPTIYDGQVLFHASHNNSGTVALADGSLTAARTAMRKQARYGTTDVINVTPRFLVVPPELEQTAYQLATSAVAVTAGANATIPNIHSTMAPPIVLGHLTDVNNWFLIADPRQTPTIELGFYKGQTEPELFVQDMGNVGSMFQADKVTWKIRHIYSGAILDFRGIYGGIVTG